jgi:hypothetical protein
MTFPAIDPEHYKQRRRHKIFTPNRADGAFARYRPFVAKVIEHTVFWPILTLTEAAQIVAEFEGAKGSAGTTTFTPPGGSPTTVRFASPRKPEKQVSGMFWSVGPVTLIEEPS